ncbi:hypothetical protein [Rubritalea tangerina]|uniref:hypothetical protein n=1 Tax=Rubritalea tangerina TaxID=430798 RepID=UPI00360F39C3
MHSSRFFVLTVPFLPTSRKGPIYSRWRRSYTRWRCQLEILLAATHNQRQAT